MMKVWRSKTVCEYLGISRSCLFNWISKGSKYFRADFPQPIRLSSRVIGWIAADIENWVLQQQANKRMANGHC